MEGDAVLFSGVQRIISILFSKNQSTLESIKEGTVFGIYEPPIKFGEGEIISFEIIDE